MKINLNGNEYGLHWGMGAIRIVCEKTGFTVEKVIELVAGIGDHPTMQRNLTTCDFLIAAIRNYNAINGTTGEPTFEQVEQFNDEATPEIADPIMKDWISSMLRGRTVAEMIGVPVPEKKSLPEKEQVSIEQS